jgi:hypothetical protein
MLRKVPDREDAIANTRDACATQITPREVIGDAKPPPDAQRFLACRW